MTEESGTGTPSNRATLLVAVGSATVSFMVGFNFGAFDVIFFDQMLAIWVIATIVFVGSIVSDLPPSTWSRRLILLLPSLWLLAAWLDNSADIGNSERIASLLTLVVTVVAFPFVAWILVTAINTDFADLPGRNRAAVIAAVGLSLVIGFGIGARNDFLLNCDDFKISGNDLPENCVQVSPEP